MLIIKNYLFRSEKMKKNDFYEREEVIHEIVEARRSEICYNLMKRLITKTCEGRKKKILDIGCGDGSFIVKFKEDCEAFGLDISGKAVEVARKAGINAYKVDISCEKTPFEDESFDIIYMGDIIEHLVNPDFATKEVLRITKPNGFLILSTPNLASWINRLLLLFGMQPLFSEVSTVKNFGRPGTQEKKGSFPVDHLRLYTHRALKEFLEYYHFKIVNIQGAPYGSFPKVLNVIDKFFSKIPSVSSILIVTSRKTQ